MLDLFIQILKFPRLVPVRDCYPSPVSKYLICSGFIIQSPAAPLVGYSIALRHDSTTNITLGLLCGRGLVKIFQSSIKRSVAQASHPMLLAAIAAEVALTHNWARIQNITSNLELVEVQTGHGLGGLSAKMKPNYPLNLGLMPVALSRLGADIGIQEIYMRSVQKLLDFILENIDCVGSNNKFKKTYFDQQIVLALQERVAYMSSASDHRQMMLENFRQTVQAHFSTVSPLSFAPECSY